MLRVVVLGAAAGGGVPQWNCGCPVCRKARSENPELRSTQASIAISADGAHWYLINASPDLRQQLIATPQLHPKAGQLRHSPIAGVILTNGEIDAVIGPRAPSCFGRDPNVGWLYPDPAAAAAAWFRKSRIFPIMHILGVRRTLAEQHPWLPMAAMKAFEQAKALALAKLGDVAASKVTLPFLDEQLHAARRLMGDDFWSYGLDANRHVLEVFLRRHHAEGLSSRVLTPEELFHPSTHETHRV